jgi:hypothetical protein
MGGAERVARACARWRAGVGGVGRCWAAGAERAHGHEQAVLKNAKVLLLGEASRVQDAVGRTLRRCAGQRCAGAARQGRGERGTSR